MNQFQEKYRKLDDAHKRRLKQNLAEDSARYGIYPLSPEQNRMWYLYLLDRSNPMYNVTFNFHCASDAVSQDVLMKAAAALFRKHGALRTKIISLDGDVYQYESDEDTPDIKCTDQADDALYAPFDLENEYPCRIRIVKAETGYTVYFCVHHMFTDGYSIQIMFNDYAAAVQKLMQSPDADPLPADGARTYVDYVKHLCDADSQRKAESDKAFWKELLHDADMQLELPYTGYTAIEPETAGTFLASDAIRKDAIAKYCRAKRITVFSFFMAVYAEAISHLCGQRDIVIGMPVLNRPDERFYEIVGFFSNSVPVRLECDPAQSFDDFAVYVNKRVAEAIDRGGIPFDEIVELAEVPRKEGQNPVFQTIFSMHSDHLLGGGSDTAETVGLTLDMGGVDDDLQFDQMCTIKEHADSYEIDLGYRTARLSEDAEQAIFRLMQTRLDALSGDAAFPETVFMPELPALAEQIANNFPEINACKVLYRYETCFVCYAANGALNEQGCADAIRKLTLDPVVFIRLAALPLNDCGEIDTEKLWDLTGHVRLSANELANANSKGYPYMSFCFAPDETEEDAESTAEEPEHEPVNAYAAEGISYLEGEPLPELRFHTLAEILMRIPDDKKQETITTIQLGNQRDTFTYEELYRKATVVAANLQRLGFRKGQSVMFQLHNIRAFIETFWGAVLAGVVAIPVDIPATSNYGQYPNIVSRIQKISEILGEPGIIADGEYLEGLKTEQAQNGTIRDRLIDQASLYESGLQMEPVEIDPEDTVLTLFTSGSTGVPKGVELRHRNILSRAQATITFNHFHDHEISLNWMPLTHVGGIVMFHVLDTYQFAKQIHVETNEILQHPVNWLYLLDEFRCTNTWAPNFAYGLINEEREEIEHADLDLSTVKFILNGGEAITFTSCDQFLNMLAPKGLPYSAMMPSWGMTETSSGVLFSNRFGQIIYNNSVSVGVPVPGTKMKIVDENMNIVPRGEIGELYAGGRTIHKGYFRNPTENSKVFTEDGWFDTGDRALLIEGEVVIAGRNKDIIVVNGVNFSNQDIEKEIAVVDGVESGVSACMSVRNQESGEDSVCIFYSKAEQYDRGDVEREISAKLLQRFGFEPDLYVIVGVNDFPRTSIGKIDKKNLLKKYAKQVEKEQHSAYKNLAKLTFTDVTAVRQNLICGKDVPESFAVSADTVTDAESLLAFMRETDNACAAHASDEKTVCCTVTVRADHPYLGFITGFCTSLPRDHAGLCVKVLIPDAALPDVQLQKLAEQELHDRFMKAGSYTAVRFDQNGARYVDTVAAVDTADAKAGAFSFADGMTVVILGGLGGIGTHAAKYLLEKYRAKLYLIGRSELEKDPEKAKKMDRLRAAAAAKHTDVSYLVCDASDSARLTDTLEKINTESQIAEILDATHAEPPVYQVDQRIAYFAAHPEAKYDAKTVFDRDHTAQGIERFLTGKRGICAITFGSAAGIFGGKTYGSYSAINSYLFDRAPVQDGNLRFTYLWSKWDGIGMSESESRDERIITEKNGYILITPEKGMQSLEKLLAAGISRAVIGVDHLHPSISSFRAVTQETESMHPVFIEQESAADAEDSSDPNVGKMLMIWQNVLGKEQIGIRDSFFNIGGNSLKSIKLIAKINEAFGSELSIMDLFRYPSVRAVTDYICPQESVSASRIEI